MLMQNSPVYNVRPFNPSEAEEGELIEYTRCANLTIDYGAEFLLEGHKGDGMYHSCFFDSLTAGPSVWTASFHLQHIRLTIIRRW
jgi:hypothetical protein